MAVDLSKHPYPLFFAHPTDAEIALFRLGDKLGVNVRNIYNKDDDPVYEIWRQCLLNARTRITDRLGLTRIIEILGLAAWTENPLTEYEFMRTRGANLEAKIVKIELLKALRSKFREGNSGDREEWNDHPIYRDNSQDNIQNEIDYLDIEIDDLFDLMVVPPEDTKISGRVYLGTPEVTPPLPGDSIRNA